MRRGFNSPTGYVRQPQRLGFDLISAVLGPMEYGLSRRSFTPENRVQIPVGLRSISIEANTLACHARDMGSIPVCCSISSLTIEKPRLGG